MRFASVRRAALLISVGCWVIERRQDFFLSDGCPRPLEEAVWTWHIILLHGNRHENTHTQVPLLTSQIFTSS